MEPSPRSRKILATIVGTFALAFLLYLILGPKPWNAGMSPRLDAGKSLRAIDYVVSFSYWSALVNLVICGVLFSLKNIILFPLPPPIQLVSHSENTPSFRAFMVGLVLTVIVAAVFNAPRLDMSLWGDEVFTMREFVIGEPYRDESGKIQIEPIPWHKTIWEYRTTNNHILYSILGRISHSFVQTPSEPDRTYFSERALHMPPYLAGLAAVAAVGIFTWLAGFRRAALLAAILLAIHPWFTRYGVEARGYALILFLQPFAMIALLRALVTGRWAWWLAYGASLFLLFWAFPGTVYFIVLLNVAALAALVFSAKRHFSRPSLARRALFTRFAIGNLLAAMLLLQLFSPCIIPFKKWTDRPRAHGDLGWPWLQDALSYLGFGFPWRPWETDNPLAITLSSFKSDHPAPFFLALSLAIALAAIGSFRLAQAPSPARWLLIPIVLPLALAYIHNSITGNLMMHWYAVGSLPGLVTVWAIGVTGIAKAFPASKPRRMASFALPALAVVAFFVFTHPQRKILWKHPVEPLYECVKSMRKILNPNHPDIDEVMTLGFHMYSVGYDPAVIRINTKEYAIGGPTEQAAVDEFIAAMNEADSSDRQLHVNIAQQPFARLMLPALMEILDNQEIFELVRVHHGLQSPCTRTIYRYKPGSVASLQLNNQS
ncbi:MAG: hypothetical protein AAGD22_00350 [Verrucomicrobiota bacterium]